MALRNIREFGDPVLNKVCLPIKEMTDRNRELINDMFETMYEANGVGLAAPQVGVLKRVFVIDVTGEDPLVFINPEITEASGSQTGYEGCLSLPGKTGTVTRPQKVKAKALDIDMKPFEIEAEDLLARAICHEYDHLEGHLYTEKLEGELLDNEALLEEESEDEEAGEEE
ncbi:MAG: peptide deformylase [Lachnospiraceae bacterium]|nr:peptide deformylase [Lachnospiraceae bacterium]